MPTDAVLDASAAVKLFRPEPESEALRAWVDGHAGTGGRLVVPPIFSFELRNSAARAVKEGVLASVATAHQAWSAIMLLVDEVPVAAADELELAVRARLTTYDAAYLALAEGRQLVTYDGPLAKVARALYGVTSVVAPT